MPVEKLPAFSLRQVTVAQPGNQVEAIIPWDINIMNIDQVWTDLGVTGAGVIVANVDTGVYYQHEALFPNYLCGAGPHTNCWFDPDGGTTAPNDTNGHGTGTMSQMAADNNAAFQYAVGGAPDAGWIACLGCPDGSCPDTALNGCADWLVMTTPNTPDIVNNSWGTWSALCDPWYDGKIAAYRVAGIVPVWAAGNIGNACNTSTPPANSIGTLAVGATTSGDVQASFSSTGPGLCSGRTQFPDISAPGDATCGATNSGGYSCGLGGTSFAAPRAAGCAALVKSANPSLTVQEIMDVLMATAVDKPNSDCGSPQPDPNFRYGDGRVDCFAAVSDVYNADNLPWVTESPITGTIPADGFQDVNLTFECTPEQAYFVLTGTLRINHTDPCEAPVLVPLEFTCEGAPGTPEIGIVPTSLASTQLHDVVTTQPMTITNIGTGGLEWNLFEAAAPAKYPGPSVVVPNNGRQVVLSASPAGNTGVTAPAPAVPDADVTLILDDGSRDNDIGLDGTIEMLWVNVFTPAPAEYPFFLNQIQIYFSSVGLVNVGDDIRLIVYQDATPDGAPDAVTTFLAEFPTTVQALDTWNVYDLPTPVYVTGPGDVLIGAIGMETPGTSYWPASMDQTVSQQRSWAGWWNASPPPVPPLLPPPNWTLIDAYFPGNWMVRGYGTTPPPVTGPCATPGDIPWASVTPTSGLLGPGLSNSLVVTFDSAGMASGFYTGTLCVASNDMTDPLVAVPVELTVQSDPNIVVTPPSLTAMQPADVVTSQTLNISNTGDVALDWNLFEWMPQRLAPPTHAAPAGTRQVVLSSAPAGKAVASAPAPVVPDADVSLILDDGINEDAIGIGGTIEFMWVNVFTPGAGEVPFMLNQVQVYFWTTGLVNVGDNMRLVVYQDTDSDPSNFADLFLYETDVTVQVLDDWNVYDLPTSVAITQPGDVWIGVIAMTVPGSSYWPAAIDTTVSQGRSWAGWWAVSPPPDPPTMPDSSWGLIDSFGFAGNWMVRGYGTSGPASCSSPAEIPWISATPNTGTIPGHGATPVDVSFDSTGLATGIYTGTLCIESNDPIKPLVQVPVELNVVPNPPSITLAKTVGTDPSVCATTDSIAVPAGTEVTYCYLVTNTGDLSPDRPHLVDSELGNLLLDFPLNLDIGASAFITASAVITEDTVNTATWTSVRSTAGGASPPPRHRHREHPVPRQADLEVEKTAPAEVNAGATPSTTRSP